MKKKQCTKCKKIKSLNKFYNRNGIKRGRISGRKMSRCKDCESQDQKEYLHSREGHLVSLFNGIKHRCNPVTWIKKSTYIGITYNFNYEQFKKFCLTNTNYDGLFKQWEESGFTQGLSPSVDRVDNNKSYTFNNIQIITQRENSSKQRNKKRNTKVSNFIGVHKDYRSNRSRRWTAKIYYKNKSTSCGNYLTELEAAVAVDRKCIELGIPQKNNLIK